MPKAKTPKSAPVCWWCKRRIPLDSPWRARTPADDLPAGSGYIVCSGACPSAPGDAYYWLAGRQEGRR